MPNKVNFLNKELPLVSIYIPSYNSSATLKKTLHSLLTIERDDIEIIIVDNKSNDGSYEMAIEFAKLDSRIVVFQNDFFVSMGNNWNNALLKCSGEFIKLLCADDLIDNDILNEHIGILKNNPGIAITTSDSYVIDESGKNIFFRKIPLIHDKQLLKSDVVNCCIKYATNIVGEPSILLMRHAAVKKAGIYDINYEYAIDLDFSLRVLDYGDLWVSSNRRATYRMHKGSVTQKVVGFAGKELYSIFSAHSPDKLDRYKFGINIKRRYAYKKAFLYITKYRIGRYILSTFLNVTHFMYR